MSLPCVLVTGQMRGNCTSLVNVLHRIRSLPSYTSTFDTTFFPNASHPKRVELQENIYQWQHLDHLLKTHNLNHCTHILKIRTDLNIYDDITSDMFANVTHGTVYARSDHTFYADKLTFFKVFYSFFERIKKEMFNVGNKYFPISHERMKDPLLLDSTCVPWVGERCCRFGLTGKEIVRSDNTSKTSPANHKFGSERYVAVQILQNARIGYFQLPIHGIWKKSNWNDTCKRSHMSMHTSRMRPKNKLQTTV